ncbi:MAG: hypothetical protein JF590_05495 [Gemmatimonadetes bacterium]|nr:hypothetical protein [Gemmatimonadota bacterium]
MSRILPFDLVFGELAEERFPALRASLAAGGTDARDRDAFILDRAVTEFLRDLVPEDAPPESLHEFIAVLQHCYLFWAEGRRVAEADANLPSAGLSIPASLGPSVYLQLPSHLYWGQLEPEAPHEPLDGFFIHPWGDGIRALGIFGVHPERPGFSVAEVAGPAPAGAPRRDDGSAPFAPLMEGGTGAGLRSVAGPEELLLLAWASLAAGSRDPRPATAS